MYLQSYCARFRANALITQSAVQLPHRFNGKLRAFLGQCINFYSQVIHSPFLRHLRTKNATAASAKVNGLSNASEKLLS